VVESVVGITALEMFLIDGLLMTIPGLYTDESPGLKVDPVVVMVLSVVFIFSVVALHGWSNLLFCKLIHSDNLAVIAKVVHRFSS
jgi:hypothetical protein